MAVLSTSVVDQGHFAQYDGSGSADNDVIIQTGDITRFDTFMLMSSAGTVDVYVSLDGTNYATAALSLQDMGATVTDPVVVSAANRVYAFRGKFRKIRVLVAGATNPTTATLMASRLNG